MTALSLQLPDYLAEASQKAARTLGVSRTSFIRSAIIEKLKHLEATLERDAMARSFTALPSSTDYLTELQEIEECLNTPLPDEPEEWWKK